MLVIQISRHCSEQILARRWEVKGKRAKLRKESEGILFYFFLRWSQVMTEELSFQVSLDLCKLEDLLSGFLLSSPPVLLLFVCEWRSSICFLLLLDLEFKEAGPQLFQLTAVSFSLGLKSLPQRCTLPRLREENTHDLQYTTLSHRLNIASVGVMHYR